MLEEPTKPMKDEALSAGIYEPEYYREYRFPKLQIFTIRQLLSGEQIQYPRGMGAATFKKAERRGKENERQEPLF